MLKTRLQRLLPDPHRLREHPALRRLGPALHHPRLWHMSRRGIAMGLAVGIFFGLLIPVAQIFFAASFAVILRANLPVAVASTLVTNPITFAPIYYAAYQLGALLLGRVDHGVSQESLHVEIQSLSDWVAFWVDRLAGLGLPLVLGLSIFACALALGAYLLVHGVWRARVVLAWRQRRQRRATGRV